MRTVSLWVSGSSRRVVIGSSGVERVETNTRLPPPTHAVWRVPVLRRARSLGVPCGGLATTTRPADTAYVPFTASACRPRELCHLIYFVYLVLDFPCSIV